MVPHISGRCQPDWGRALTNTSPYERVLVTGATGFIGRHVVSRLRTAGTEIAAVSLHGGQIEGVRVDALDLRDREHSHAMLSELEFDAVVHLAASLPEGTDPNTMQESFDGSVASAVTIVSFCRSTGCPLVWASSSSVYGSMTGEPPVSEDQLPRPETLYAVAKYIGDVLCLQLSLETGVPASILRLSAPYGPGNRRSTVIDIFLRAALESEDIRLQGSGRRAQDFTFIDDVVDAIERALLLLPSGVFNVATGRPVSMRDLAEAVLSAVPESRSRIVSGGGADPQEDYRAFMEVSKARERFGWSARVPLVEGLRLTASAIEAGR